MVKTRLKEYKNYIGLPNVGHSCFMASLIQSLLSINSIGKYNLEWLIKLDQTPIHSITRSLIYLITTMLVQPSFSLNNNNDIYQRYFIYLVRLFFQLVCEYHIINE